MKIKNKEQFLEKRIKELENENKILSKHRDDARDFNRILNEKNKYLVAKGFKRIVGLVDDNKFFQAYEELQNIKNEKVRKKAASYILDIVSFIVIAHGAEVYSNALFKKFDVSVMQRYYRKYNTLIDKLDKEI